MNPEPELRDHKKLVAGMQEVYRRLIKEAIAQGETLIVSRNGRIMEIDPRTMEEVKPQPCK